MGSFSVHQPRVDLGSTSGRLPMRPAVRQRYAIVSTRVTSRQRMPTVTATATSERDSARSGTATSTSTSVVTNQAPGTVLVAADSAGARQAAQASSSQPSPLSSVDRLVHQEMSLRTDDWGQELYWEWDYNSQICYRQVRVVARVLQHPTSRGPFLYGASVSLKRACKLLTPCCQGS